MSTTIVLVVVIPLLVATAALVTWITTRRTENSSFGHTAELDRTVRRRDAQAASDSPVAVGAAPTGREVEAAAALARIESNTELTPMSESSVALPEWTPPDAEKLGVTRRQFLNRASLGLTGLGLSGFGAATLSFLWPKAGGGFGSKVKVGTRADVDAAIASSQPATNFAYFAEAQAYVQPYPSEALPAARGIYDERIVSGMEEGYVALWQKCPHLGCRVPSCETSQWFECPCHGSQYNRVGEKRGGPAPRGMDRFPITFEGDDVVIDTGTVVPGPIFGTNTTGQGQEGPNCTSGGHG